jgi:hypothetical protein
MIHNCVREKAMNTIKDSLVLKYMQVIETKQILIGIFEEASEVAFLDSISEDHKMLKAICKNTGQDFDLAMSMIESSVLELVKAYEEQELKYLN